MDLVDSADPVVDHSLCQGQPLSADTVGMENFLVSYEHGSGTVWGYVTADVPQEIVAFLPEVDVWEELPAGMPTALLEDIAVLPAVPVDAVDAIDALLGNYQVMNAALVS